MERDFWLERWKNNQIGFHQAEFSPYLNEYWKSLAVDKSCQVFVPLAGKSKDMLWLTNEGHKVYGVELSEIAVKAFFEENGLEYTVDQKGKHLSHVSDDLEFLCGDFFHISPDNTKHVKAVFDRASLVAMPPEFRTRYADHMGELLTQGSKILLISMEYPEGEMSGPPFSVSEAEVRELYEKNFDVELKETIDVLANNQHMKDRGLTAMDEKVYLLTRK